ncbi:Sugar transport protein 2 [Hibiscus syriacus]|uniref:Sugar transport protein 2 n=1 Tax=Hibiscus syriacus TaxID=106335 RepID=A0A6A3C1W5_HIBSY|nr:Sugar transport protein 2 [Hibiscus syriacus]
MSGNPIYPSKFTLYVGICWILAAFGGLMFGYDIGISGGVTAMDDFLIKFFPKVHERKMHAKEDNYCKYDDQYLQLFTSSLYLAALVSSFFASKVCTKFGRKPTILAASLFFLAGAALSSGAPNLWMLIIGRVLLGIGVGFGNEAVPLFLSEIAPVQHRGAVNILFQLFVTIGILIANMVNYWTSKLHPYGWRVSLGIAGVPAAILFIGSLIITETPASLVEHGKESSGYTTLQKIRGVKEVDVEFQQIKRASEIAQGGSMPYVYAPVLFQTVGFKNDASLLSSVITGLVNVCCTLVSVVSVDRFGRRILLLQACVQMFISQVVIGVILQRDLNATDSLSKPEAIVVVFLVCLFVSAFAWSWGPLGWLIPSETFPLETRTAGFAFAVSSNMLCTFIIAQAFLSMLCHMRALIFFFFGGWILVMGIFVYYLLPETKNVPIDAMVDTVWNKHRVWKKFTADEN